jgi:hypothetical protein
VLCVLVLAAGLGVQTWSHAGAQREKGVQRRREADARVARAAQQQAKEGEVKRRASSAFTRPAGFACRNRAKIPTKSRASPPAPS